MKKALVAVSSLLALALTAGAALAEYSPTLEFSLSDTKVGASPSINIVIQQEADEEELGHVTLTLPKGFNIAADEAIPGGELLGNADLEIGVGTGCSPGQPGAIPISQAVPIPARQIIEQDLTDEQADRGVHAAWLVDLQPVTTIQLEITGSAKKGWKLDGDIPANEFTCPPLTFDGTINATSESGVPLITNPKKPGNYTFGGALYSASSPDVAKFSQVVKITK